MDIWKYYVHSSIITNMQTENQNQEQQKNTTMENRNPELWKYTIDKIEGLISIILPLILNRNKKPKPRPRKPKSQTTTPRKTRTKNGDKTE